MSYLPKWPLYITFNLGPVANDKYITKQKRAPPIAAPIVPPGVVTKAFTRLFQHHFFWNLLCKDYTWDLNETLQDCS